MPAFASITKPTFKVRVLSKCIGFNFIFLELNIDGKAVYGSFPFLRCIEHHGHLSWCIPQGNPCKCDTPLVWRAYHQIWSCPTWSCRSDALQVFLAIKSLSCWFPFKICFPWFRFVCRCKWCACPRLVISWRCFVFKMCAFFGSGKIWL